MKALLLTSALAAGLAVPAAAQTTTPASPFQTEAAGPSVSASDLIGARIYASEAALEGDSFTGIQEGWDDIGEVNDVILGRDGTVDAVLVDIGGFLGIGERQVAVDMSALRFVQDSATDADDWFLVVQADRAALDAAPEWPAAGSGADATTGMTETPVVPDTSAGADSTTAPDTTASGTDTTAAPDATAGADTSAGADATAGADTYATPDPATGTTGDVATAPDATTPGSPATTPEAGDLTAAPGASAPLPEGYAAIAPDALTAEMLTGANVHDMADVTIAEVSDLVLTPEGQATEVVVDVGGLLGIGAKQVAIPMERVTVAQNADGAVQVYVDMTKDELKALPEFQS
ncbi:PRC-barrel domain-containing protein [Albidovulum sp.]|uniref:PRC-barrel domain-containing protein n=1 Tax=Albidovulum sp. TaxID=1872424 RepID=UPI0039B84FF6